MLEFLQIPFMQRALLAGSFMGLVLSLIGVFVVLKKSAFFGDAVAHFAFAGIAAGFLLAVNPLLAAIAVSLLLALGMGWVQNRAPAQSLDTIIGIFFSGAAALGIFIIGLLRGYRVDLFQFLFGDIIAISNGDIITAAIITVCALGALALAGKPLFRIAFNREIAYLSGVRVTLLEFMFLGLLAVVTAVSIKVVGIILVPALLVIPAAAAKNISRTFRHMIVYSAIFGVASVVLGLISSFYLNTASGATIVLFGIVIFALTLLKKIR